MALSVGVELGDEAVRGVILESGPVAPRLVAAEELLLEHPSEDALVEALRQLRQRLSIKRPVVLGVPTSSAIVTTVHPLIVNRHRAHLAIEFELQQRLPYETDQALWHCQPYALNGASTDSAAPSVVVAATKRALLESRLHACRRAGLQVRAVEAIAVAATNAWFRQAEHHQIAHEALLHLDRSVVEWVAMTPTELQVFQAFHHREEQGTEALRAVLTASWRNLEGVFQHKPAQEATRVWLLGGTTALHLLADDLKRELGCEVQIVQPSAVVDVESAALPNPWRFLVACGLALQGLGEAKFPVNLLAEAQRRRLAERLRRAANAAANVCLGLAVVLLAHGMVSALHQRRAQLDTLTQRQEVYEQLRPQARSLLKQQAVVEQRLRQLAWLANTRGELMRAFQRLATALPDGVWLTRVELSKTEGLSGTVEGYARSFPIVTELVDRLTTSAGWTAVKPLATTVTVAQPSGQELVAFTIQVQGTVSSPVEVATP